MRGERSIDQEVEVTREEKVSDGRYSDGNWRGVGYGTQVGG